MPYAPAACAATALVVIPFLTACGGSWNDPYPAAERGGSILYAAFVERPKHLDPVQSYTEDEGRFIQQIYEPPLQYHYLRRPYELVPLTATQVPEPRIVRQAGGLVSIYEIRIRPGIRYQPHPAFEPAHHRLSRAAIAALRSPYELAATGTRELVADDYIYQIKRLAHPRLHSPIFGLISGYLAGLKGLAERLKEADEALAREGRTGEWLDLRQVPLEGVERIDAYTFRITLQGRYPQFAYWLAMPFFAPVPWEVEKFFHQPGMAEKNFNLDWWPVGTGPYMLTQNDPNARMVLERNPNFRGEAYPDRGEPGDAEAGLLADAGRAMPFIDRIVFSREKEGIPHWNKFLQGYYDFSGISADNFDQAVRVSVEGDAVLTDEMEARGIRLRTAVSATVIYLGFNWLDPVVGGSAGGEAAARARKLRQAIAMAIDMEEYLSIFANGRGLVAHGPLAPGIFGWREGERGINPVTHRWRDGAPRRRPVEEARRLLAEAGFANGRDAKTGTPLVLNLDTVGRGPGDKQRLDWYRKQFAKLSIPLQIRETDWNRFQEKLRTGSQQLYIVGWNADYPDPENFLFLLHGLQARVSTQGENASNYANPEFDALFERMKNMRNSAERGRIVDLMLEIVRQDAPWVFGFHPKEYSLYHAWLRNMKPNNMARNNLKYLRLDPQMRAAQRADWNRPVLWPLWLLSLLLVAGVVLALRTYRARERARARRAVDVRTAAATAARPA